MAKVLRNKKKVKRSAEARIELIKEKYGDAVALIQDVDRKPGSPSQWKADYTRMIFWFALSGMTDAQMANCIGCSIHTVALWKRTHPDFLRAYQAGKEEAVAEASYNMFRRACGFEYMEEKLIPTKVKHFDDNGKLIKEETEIKRVECRKYALPNVTALDKFLKAKKPEVWGDKSVVDHIGNVNHSIDVKNLSKKQLKLMQKLQQTGKKEVES